MLNANRGPKSKAIPFDAFVPKRQGADSVAKPKKDPMALLAKARGITALMQAKAALKK